LRKQIRQVPNLRYTARGRPQSMHRRTSRVENFGGRLAAAIFDLLAMLLSGALGWGDFLGEWLWWRLSAVVG
jgi:hypothetical protein